MNGDSSALSGVARDGVHAGCRAWRCISATLAMIVLCVGFEAASVKAALPSLTGFVNVNFSFQPDDPGTPGDQSYWYFNGHTQNLVLTLPAVMDISAVPGPGTLDWATPANWTTIPLDTSGFSITQSGSGSFTATVNGGSPNLDALRGLGPTEGSTVTDVNVTNVSSPGNGNCPQCEFGVSSNFADTHFNVTLPAGVQMTNNQFQVKVQNLTVNSGANMVSSPAIVRENLTNHGTGKYSGLVQGNLINDALVAGGNTANVIDLQVNGQLQNTGELHVPAGNFVLQSATSNSATGTLRLNGGSFRPAAALTNNGTLALSAGLLSGPGTVTNNGTFQWTGGWIDGAAGSVANVINTSNAFTISGPAGKIMFAPLTNSGTMTHSGGTMDIGGQTTLSNQTGAVYNMTDDTKIGSGFQGGFFSNAGTFRKSGGSGVSTVESGFANTGSVQVDTGTLKFTGGGSLNGGTMTFAAGTTAEILAGDFSLIGTNTASGAGTLNISNGRVIVANGNSGGFASFTGGANLAVTNTGQLYADTGGTLTLNLTGVSSVQLSGGSIAKGGTTINNGNFQWTGVMIDGNFTNNSANFTMTGSSGRNLFTGTLANNGTIVQSGGNTDVGSGGTVANQSGGLYDILDDSDIGQGFQGGFLTNAGTFRKSGGSGTTSISIPFSNTGTIVIASGTLLAGGTLTLGSTGTVEIKLGGTTAGNDYGKLFASPTLAANGTLKVALTGGFNPALGNSFDILDSSNPITGSFTNLILPTLNAGLVWNVNSLLTTGVISVMAEIQGDYNRNGVVDAADYVVWRKTLNQTGANLPADGNHSGTVDTADLDLWRSRFGLTSGRGGSVDAEPVPELSSLCFATAGLAFFCFGVRRRLDSRLRGNDLSSGVGQALA
jgi:hypothetical protein